MIEVGAEEVIRARRCAAHRVAVEEEFDLFGVAVALDVTGLPSQPGQVQPATFFDPELAAALVELGGPAPTTATPEDVPAARERINSHLSLLTNEALSRDGLFEIQERTVPGPPDAPDLSLPICRPTAAPDPCRLPPAKYRLTAGLR